MWIDFILRRWDNVTIRSYERTHHWNYKIFLLSFGFFYTKQIVLIPWVMSVSSYHWWTLTLCLYSVFIVSFIPFDHRFCCFICIECAVLCVCASKELHIYHFNIYLLCSKDGFRNIVSQMMTLVRWAEMRACGFKVKHPLFSFTCLY